MSIYPIIMSQGKFVHKDSLMFPFEERGLQFGDGVYEVIRVYNGKPYLMEEHAARLIRSLDAIRIKIDQDKNEVKELLLELLQQNKIETDSYIYLQVTRGSAPRAHVFPEDAVPNFYAYIVEQARPLKKLQHGVKSMTIPDERWENCYIKSLNLLPNIIAKQTALENGCYDAILHQDGKVTECGSSNIYLVKEGKIYTHPATKQILHGCVRMAVERFANELEIPFIEEAFQVDDIYEADEIFLTSSTSEVLPVVEVDQRAIANGKPGEISRKLQAIYEKDAQVSLEKVD